MQIAGMDSLPLMNYQPETQEQGQRKRSTAFSKDGQGTPGRSAAQSTGIHNAMGALGPELEQHT